MSETYDPLPSADTLDGFEIRRLSTLAEFRQCVALQEDTWGRGFSERVPVAILMVSQRLCGVRRGGAAGRPPSGSQT